MNKSMRWKSVLVLCSAIAIGCGDDDSGSPDSGSGGAFAGGTGGDIGAGTGGTTGAGTGGTTGTGGGTSTAMPVPCGSNMCGGGAAAIPGLPAPMACCVDMTMGTCGTMSGGMCTPPPQPDPRCPMVTILGSSMPSCCATNGMCGLDASMLGMGCVDYAAVKMSMFGAILMVPNPVNCDGSSASDGGSNDGG